MVELFHLSWDIALRYFIEIRARVYHSHLGTFCSELLGCCADYLQKEVTVYGSQLPGLIPEEGLCSESYQGNLCLRMSRSECVM